MGSAVGTAPAASGGITMPPRAAQIGLAGHDALQQFVRRRHAHHAHERRAGNAHAGQLRRHGKAVRHLPVHQEGRGEEIAQEAEARHDHGEAAVGRNDLLDLHGQQIARLRALDVHRASQRMDAAHLDAGEIRRRGGLA